MKTAIIAIALATIAGCAPSPETATLQAACADGNVNACNIVLQNRRARGQAMSDVGKQMSAMGRPPAPVYVTPYRAYGY
jgi:hypothetical protein